MNLKIIKNIREIIEKYKDLFLVYDNVFLFGSVLKNSHEYQDIDMLLVYSKDFEEIVKINSLLNNIFIEYKLPIDLTILSKNELQETNFLNKIDKYIKII